MCYQAKLATKTVPQNGCGPVDPADKGSKIVPKQPKHAPQRVQVGNQLGGGTLDTKKESLLCIPSTQVALGVSTTTTLDPDGGF